MFSKLPPNITNKLFFSHNNFLQRNIHSLFPKISIPNIYLEEFIWKNIGKWEDKVALVCAETKKSYTYLEVYNKSNALANFLHHSDKLKQTDTVAIALPNIPEYPIIMLGSIQAGLKVTTVNPFYTAGEMFTQLIHSETKLIFTTNGLYNTILQALHLAKVQIPVVIIKTKADELLPSGSINFNDIVENNHKIQFNLIKNQNDTIILPYSSGTTGGSKGVELTTKNMVSQMHQITTSEVEPLNEANGSYQETIPAVLPMYHTYGMVLILLKGLSKGCKVVTVSKFSSKLFLNVLQEFQSTMAYLVPPIFLLLINNDLVKRHHLSSLKTIVSGAAPLGAADIARFHRKFDEKINILQAYGLTECSPLTHIQTSNIRNGHKSGSSGFLLPLTEAKIVFSDNETKELGDNQAGEILLRGPQVMKGYYKNQKATQDAFTSDGWFKSGDIGYYDEDGHFYITDRIKELIKVKGFQVAPAELEELLRKHPQIEDAAVVAVPHTIFGEVPKAFIVPKSNSKLTSTKIQSYIKGMVVSYKQLSGGVTFIDSIPKSPSGKILRRLLE